MKIKIAPIITSIVCFIIGLVLVISGLNLHSNFSIGFDKDCKQYVESCSLEENYPIECQDFSKYHMMLIISIMCLSFGFFLWFSTSWYLSGIIENEKNNNRN